MNEAEMKLALLEMIFRLQGERLKQIYELFLDELADEEGEITPFSILTDAEKQEIIEGYKEKAKEEEQESNMEYQNA